METVSEKTVALFNKIVDAVSPYVNKYSAADCIDEKSIELFFPYGDKEYPLLGEATDDQEDDYKEWYTEETHLCLSIYINGAEDTIVKEESVVRLEGDIDGIGDGVIDIVELDEADASDYPETEKLLDSIKSLVVEVEKSFKGG